MLFFLLSILCFLHLNDQVSPQPKSQQKTAGRNSSGAVWYALSLAAFLLAMLSKVSVAVLPLLLLLITWWRTGQLTKQTLFRTTPFFLVTTGLTLVNIWFQTHGSGVQIRDATFAERCLGAGAVVWFYLFQAILPINLSFIYPQWQIQVGDWRWWLPLLATLVVTILLWSLRNSPKAP